MIKFLCEAIEKQGLNINLTNIFTFIGMAFSIIVSLVALVWLTCFAVRLLIRTFKVQVQNSYDVYVENSTAKANSKKERNALKRQAKDARKLEILNMKKESKDRIHQMKVNKLGIKLLRKEEKAQDKIGAVKTEAQKDVSAKSNKVTETIKTEEVLDVKPIVEEKAEAPVVKKRGRPAKNK